MHRCHFPRKRSSWLLLALVVFGCARSTDEPGAGAPSAGAPSAGAPSDGAPVVAFVAASTKDAVQEAAAAFTATTHVEVKLNADDSSKLAVQIVEDAPAHLFLSANERWADFVQDKGFAAKTTVLLGNALVLVTPRGNPAGVRGVADLTRPTVKRVAVAGPTVPAGIYARQALRNLKVWDALDAGKRVVAGANVRVTLTYVERGEVDAGIVYATDARISREVDLVDTFPANTHDPIRYPLVLLNAGNASPSARAFFEYLQSRAARDGFARYGFTLVNAQ